MSLRDQSYDSTSYAGDFDNLANHMGDVLVFQIKDIAMEEKVTKFGTDVYPTVKDVLAVHEDGSYTMISGEQGMTIFPMVIGRIVKGAHDDYMAAPDEEKKPPYVVGKLALNGRTYVLDRDLTDTEWKAADTAVASYEDF